MSEDLEIKLRKGEPCNDRRKEICKFFQKETGKCKALIRTYPVNKDCPFYKVL